MSTQTFQLSVRTTLGDWTLHKRLSELVSLRTDLMRRLPTASIPPLKVHDAEAENERVLEVARRAVEVWIQSVLSRPELHTREMYAWMERRKRSGQGNGHKERVRTVARSC